LPLYDKAVPIGGAAVSAAPTKQLVHFLVGVFLGWCSSWLVGALETSAPPVVWSAYLTAMHSTSTKAFFGRVFTATAERAGNGCEKNSA